MEPDEKAPATTPPPAARLEPRPPVSPAAAGPGGPPRPRRDYRSYNRRKVCSFCVDRVTEIDYKDIGRLRRYVSERGRIEPRRKTGTCAKHQRRLTNALKRARMLALMPATSDQVDRIRH